MSVAIHIHIETRICCIRTLFICFALDKIEKPKMFATKFVVKIPTHEVAKRRRARATLPIVRLTNKRMNGKCLFANISITDEVCRSIQSKPTRFQPFVVRRFACVLFPRSTKSNSSDQMRQTSVTSAEYSSSNRLNHAVCPLFRWSIGLNDVDNNNKRWFSHALVDRDSFSSQSNQSTQRKLCFSDCFTDLRQTHAVEHGRDDSRKQQFLLRLRCQAQTLQLRLCGMLASPADATLSRRTRFFCVSHFACCVRWVAKRANRRGRRNRFNWRCIDEAVVMFWSLRLHRLEKEKYTNSINEQTTKSNTQRTFSIPSFSTTDRHTTVLTKQT